MTANDRRMQLLQVLCKRKHDNIENLANEFQVSFMTIRRDIEALSYSHIPIYTTQGKGGGVHIDDDYVYGMKYLTEFQAQVLERLSKNLTGNDLKTVQAILKTFCKPKRK